MLTKQLKLACLLLFFSFSAGANYIGTDSTFILVKVLNNSSKNSYFINYTEYGSYFYRYSYTSSGLSRKPPSGPFYKLSANAPVKFSVFANVRGIIEGITLPGDTTYLEIDFSNPESPVKFFGKTADVCDFYNAANKAVRNTYFKSFNYNTSASYIDYFLYLEEKYQSQDSFYNAYAKSKKLPDWFQSFHKTNLVYEKALAMIENIHTINYNTRIKVYPTPEFLLWFRDVPINNTAAVGNQIYFDFLWQYFLWKTNIIWNRASGGRVYTEWFSKVLPAINQELKDTVKEWFLKELLVNYFAVKDVDEVDSVFLLVKPAIRNNQYLEEITRWRNKSIENKELRFAGSAKVGSKAPRFHLVDSLNVSYGIDKFFGNWVLMRFYNSKSFNAANFENKVSVELTEAKLLNIYTDFNPDSWKKAISKYPHSALHLFCKGNWGEMITYQYGLRSFPYWVLVDPKGIIQYSGNADFNAVLAILKNK